MQSHLREYSIFLEVMFNFPLSTEFKRQTKTSTTHRSFSVQTARIPIRDTHGNGNLISFYCDYSEYSPAYVRYRPNGVVGTTKPPLNLTKYFIRLGPARFNGALNLIFGSVAS